MLIKSSKPQWNEYFDVSLLVALVLLCGLSFIVLYSASGERLSYMTRHSIRLGFAFAMMLLFTRIPMTYIKRWSPYLFVFGMILLLIVLAVGFVGKGAQRWIDLGVFRFQPSEIMKLAVPMMVAWLLTQSRLPPSIGMLIAALTIIMGPVTLIILQPDLGTSLLIAAAGLVVVFLAGINWRFIVYTLLLLLIAAPLAWVFVMHDYQRTRVLTLLDPWSDPLGAGYHTIQSAIAIGSGGFGGKGWLSGSQTQLDFIPERSTDFIFAVFAEEFGLLGVIVLFGLYFFIIARGLAISFYAKDTYSRLLAGSLSATFFFYVFVNIGMVSGMLPVVGVPLPLISYGGTSMVTLMISFGILMSIHKNKPRF